MNSNKNHIDGDSCWYKDDKLHREDGPALEFDNGHKEWWINDELHRLDGPAIEFVDGCKAWYYHGKFIDCQNQEEFERIINLISFI